jgi:hypothetical protein
MIFGFWLFLLPLGTARDSRRTHGGNAAPNGRDRKNRIQRLIAPVVFLPSSIKIAPKLASSRGGGFRPMLG